MVRYLQVYEGNELEYTPNKEKKVSRIGTSCHIYLPLCFEDRKVKKVIFEE